MSRVQLRLQQWRLAAGNTTYDSHPAYRRRLRQGVQRALRPTFFSGHARRRMLRLGRCRVEVNIRTVMMIDSLDMTDADRVDIVQNCRQVAEERIVIPHGTRDTMTETAAAIAREITGKVIVLTGAMAPYAFGSSDGLFNLRSALCFVQVLSTGVYISMNGKCFPWNPCRKNHERGEFEEFST